jgi:hypothetical protein
MFIFTDYRFVFEIRNRMDGMKEESRGARRRKEEGRMDRRVDGRTL